jgi:hypothetical protein
MVNYQRTKIYKIEPIVPHEEGEIYIGSTTKQYLSQRWGNHTVDFRANKHRTTACVLFEKYGVENCKIELLEYYPCNSRDEQQKKEGEYIRQMPCVNRCVAGRTKTEYCAMYQAVPENKERKLELQRIRCKKENYTEDEWRAKMDKQKEYRFNKGITKSINYIIY